jgi:cytochrome c556
MPEQHEAMRRIGTRWAEVGHALERRGPAHLAAARAAVASVARDAAAIPAFELHAHAEARPAFEAIAADFRARLGRLDAALASEDPVAASYAWRATDLASCTRCHLEFRWGLVADLSRFPSVAPAALGEAATPEMERGR